MHFSTICLSSARFRSTLRTGVVASLLALCASSGAHADALQDVSTLLKQEKFAQALEAADKYLAAKPKDAQGRFLKGIALTEMKRLDAATSVFQKLTEDYPELPEPYNNLAVIYAQQKQYEKAKAALEMAIRTHPAYATAHENLGDIYARLASQAYDKALQLDSSNSSAQSKLSLINDLMVGVPGARMPAGDGRKPVTAIAAAPTPAPAPASTPSKPAGAPTTVAAATPASAPVAVAAAVPPVAKPTAEPAKPSEPASKPAVSAGDSDAVMGVVSAWAAAWSRKDVKGYLAFYAKEFKTPGGVARSAWEAERHQRIDKPGKIEVSVKTPQVSVENDKAVVRFRQVYSWNGQDKSANKRLDLVKREGRWLIAQETVGG